MKRAFAILMSLLVVTQLMAGPVSRHEAMKAAQQFLNKRGIKASALKESSQAPMTRAAEGSENTAYYIFNVGNNGGFVIVSGDDRTDAVLGYSTSGEFDEATIPDNMRAWLQGYADQISMTRSYTRASDSNVYHDPIKPLLKTTWDQNKPYNLNCPKDEKGDYCATGCAATALAQVMNYYRYPKDLPEMKGYTTETKEIYVDALPGVTDFNWDALKTTYSDKDTDENIATLMRYCGQSLNMDYISKDASEAYDYVVNFALCSKFNYASAKHAYRSQYSAKGWDEVIYDELFNKRPVLYFGISSGGGHAFVCDGYDGYGYYHINWGWSGYKDSYFRLNVLKPDGGGIGASTTNDGYNYRQSAIINVKTTGEPEIDICTDYRKFNCNSEKDSLSIEYINRLGKQYFFDIGVGYLAGDSICFHNMLVNRILFYEYGYIEKSIAISDFNNLPDGTYKIVPISRVNGTEKWLDCRKNNDVYAEINVADGVATFVAMHPIEKFVINVDIPDTLFANCLNKIGVTIINNQTEDIQKNVCLYYRNLKSEDIVLKSEDTILPLKAKAGESMTGYLTFCPPSIGEYFIEICDKDTDKDYYTKNVSVAAISEENYNVTLSNPRFKGGSSPCLLIDVTNNDSFDHKSRKAKALIYKEDEYSFYSFTVISKLESIPIGETVTLSFDIEEYIKSPWTMFSNIQNKIEYYYKVSLLNPYVGEYDKEFEFIVPRTKFYTAELGIGGCASFAKPEALDFSDCDDLEAYTGKVDNNKECIVMTKREQVPANTGFVLKGTKYERYAIKAIDSAEEIPDNDLVAVIEDKTIDAGSALTLDCIDNIVGFYNFAGTVIKAGQSYLPKTKTGDVSYLRLQWGSDPSAITNISDDKKIFPSATYNLEGQKVDENYKGIVIRNGKIFLAR